MCFIKFFDFEDGIGDDLSVGFKMGFDAPVWEEREEVAVEELDEERG